MQNVALSADDFPALQFEQELEPVAVLYVPDGHGLQAARPEDAARRPAAQGTHKPCPVDSAIFPALQLAQDEEPIPE